MAIMKMLILLAAFLVFSHARDNISFVNNKELSIDITEHDCNDGGAPKNEPWVVTTQQNSLDLTHNNNGDNTNPARNDGALENEPTMATIQLNSLDLTQNNNGDNTNPTRNDVGVPENEPMLATTQQNSLDLTQNNNGNNTNSARNDGVLQNEPTMATTHGNSLDLTQNNNGDITNPARNDVVVLENEPTLAMRQQNSLDLIQNNYGDNTNPARNDGVLQNEPTAQENSLDLTQNNIGDNINPAMNDDEVLENEPILATAEHNPLDLTQNNNGDNTCPARTDEELLENEPTMVMTLLNLWNLAMNLLYRNNNGDHRNPVLNNTNCESLDPMYNNNCESLSWITLVTRYIGTRLNLIRQYRETTLPRYMIGASAISQVPGEFPRHLVNWEFPGRRQTQHVDGVQQYGTASLQGISRTASHPRIYTQHKAARAVGNLLLWWGSSVLLSGFVSMLQAIDFFFIIMILFFKYIRFNWRIHKLFFAMTCVISVVLSTVRLASQHFGEAEEAYKVGRSIAFNVFYVIALIDALVNFALIAY